MIANLEKPLGTAQQNKAQTVPTSFDDIISKSHMEFLSWYVKHATDFITKIHNLKGIPHKAFFVT